MDVVQKCKNVWSSATSDTEKFAALLVIVKLAKTVNLSSSECSEIFNTIGFSFIARLLQTEDVPEGCSAMIYKSLALSVLLCFCSNQEIAESDRMCCLTAECKSILDGNSFSASEESLVIDTLDCLYSMCEYEKGRQRILEDNIIPYLVNLYVNDTCGKQKSLEILKVMTFYLKNDVWKNDSSAFNDLFIKLSRELTEGNVNVDLFRTILSFLLDHPLCQVQGDEEWAVDIQVVLTKVLRCEISKELRDLAIQLASLMVKKCGTFWFGDDTDHSKMFFLVLISIVCVEVQLVFEGRTIENILKDTFVISACYSALESVIAAMVDESLSQNLRPYVKELITSVRAAYKTIIGFLRTVSIQWNSLSTVTECAIKQLTYASIRALCAWLAEETGVLHDEVHEILPFVLIVCNECFLAKKAEESSHAAADDVYQVDLMRFFIPPLCHLITDDDSRAILLQHELPSILFEYLYYQWWSNYQPSPSSEIAVLLSTICGVILDIVVMETKVVSESTEFFSFLRFLFHAVSLLPSDFENFSLKANFSTLGLLITKLYYRRITSCETSFYRFLAFSVKFLWDAHHVEDENNTTSFVLVREYRHVWSDIMEHWFLGIQALLTLLPVMPWIANFLMESGWPQHIITSLLRVDENSIEENVKYAYQAFLSALVRVSKDVIPTLIDCEAVVVCQKHKLKELGTLLSQ